MLGHETQPIARQPFTEAARAARPAPDRLALPTALLVIAALSLLLWLGLGWGVLWVLGQL